MQLGVSLPCVGANLNALHYNYHCQVIQRSGCMSMDRPRRILVVDDDEKNTILVQTFLEALGYESVAARDGSEALELLDSDIDLVLLDLVMPGMDGYEVTRRIRASSLHGDIPIIIVTVLSDKADRLAALEAGANDFVCKPIDRVELQTRVSSLLKARHFQEEAKRQRDELDGLAAQRKRADAAQEKARLELERLVHQRTAELVAINRHLQEEIHGRKITEEALRESEARYRDLFEQASDLVYVHDIQGNYTSVNPAVERILG